MPQLCTVDGPIEPSQRFPSSIESWPRICHSFPGGSRNGELTLWGDSGWLQAQWAQAELAEARTTSRPARTLWLCLSQVQALGPEERLRHLEEYVGEGYWEGYG